MSVQFFCENVRFALTNPPKTAKWLQQAASTEQVSLYQITCIFCSDPFLLTLNKRYLNHDTYTDILTFDYTNASTPSQLEGDLFVSVDRVRENARTFRHNFDQELHRVLIHGILHLIGFDDKTVDEQALMRKKEKKYLALLPEFFGKELD